MKRIEPSLEENIAINAAWFFKAESPEVRHFGNAINELLREVAWSDDCIVEEVIRHWQPRYSYPEIMLRDVKKQFRQVLADPKIKEALAKPSGNVELWRERSFDVILDQEWISGIFDRVVIWRDAVGNPLAAQLTDYKSNRINYPEKINALAKVYRPQISLYRQTLSRLLNLPEEKIETRLLFTVPCRIVSV